MLVVYYYHPSMNLADSSINVGSVPANMSSLFATSSPSNLLPSIPSHGSVVYDVQPYHKSWTNYLSNGVQMPFAPAHQLPSGITFTNYNFPQQFSPSPTVYPQSPLLPSNMASPPPAYLSPTIAPSPGPRDVNALYAECLAVWLKRQRMHKYYERLSKYTFVALLQLNRQDLLREKFTQGAITKMLGMLEVLRKDHSILWNSVSPNNSSSNQIISKPHRQSSPKTYIKSLYLNSNLSPLLVDTAQSIM